MTDALVDNIKRFLLGLADVFYQFKAFFDNVKDMFSKKPDENG